eukprot:COSAG02_NODE_5987_length_3887_cov_2.044879_4_plen_312_part_00
MQFGNFGTTGSMHRAGPCMTGLHVRAAAARGTIADGAGMAWGWRSAGRCSTCSLTVVVTAAAALAAQHCPNSQDASPPPPPLLSARVLHSSRVLTAGPYCSNYIPPPPPPSPPPHLAGRLVHMAPCTGQDPLQSWTFAADGALQLNANSSACITYVSGSGPVVLLPCRDPSGAPADLPLSQRWVYNTSLGAVVGGPSTCLDIRENTAPSPSELTGDVHAASKGCLPPAEVGANMRWQYESGHLVSKCPSASSHCGRWAGQCMTAQVADEQSEARAPANQLPTAASIGGDCAGYYDYGGPACGAIEAVTCSA